MPNDMDDVVEATLGISRDDLPANSHASKNNQPAQPSSQPARQSPPPEPKYVVKKKTLWRRIKEAFIGDDVKSIPEYLLFDVLIPSTKKLLRDSFDEAADRLFGVTGSRSKSTRQDSGYLVYDRPSDPNVPSRKMRPGIDFENYWFASRDDALAKLEEIRNLFSNAYDGVTVAQVKELFRQYPKSIDNKWGWMTARNSDVVQSDGGWIIYMPPPKYLD